MAGGCSLTFPTPLHVPVAWAIGGVIIDDGCDYLYLTNTTFNRVEVFSLRTLSFEAPIQVGSLPVGLDFAPDSNLLYVCNSGGNNLSVVDVVQRVELRKITTPAGFSNEKPVSVAIANNGHALIGTNTSGPYLLDLVLATNQVTERIDSYTGGRKRVVASGDRSVIGIVAGDTSAGPVFKYTAATGTFGPWNELDTTVADVSLDMTGSMFLVTPGSFVLNGTLTLAGTIPGGSGWGASVMDSTWGVGYRSLASRLDVLSLSSRQKTGELALGDTVTTANSFNVVGRMDISGDGTLIAAITDHGFSLVRPWTTTPAFFNLVRNGSFANGLTRWFTFATPDPSALIGGVTNGVFEFYRAPPPPGTSNQAVIYQETGMGLPAGAPIQADFHLGNSSNVRKRMSVLLLDADFSDLHVCTFWLPANAPMRAYRMRTHTTRPWVNAAIYFYAATPGSDGGSYRIDNVSLVSSPALPDDRTDCVDPLAPIPPGGTDGDDLLVNGDFGAGPLTPWAVFGTLTSQIAGGVFEFIRPTSAPPAGVVLQATGQAMTENQILTATLQFGNTSAARKRVTVVLHDSDFSDLAACTFWLPPGQALSPYAVRTCTTQPWANATLSVYAATVGPDQWIQLDNATLKRTPGVAVTGTECVEPASPGVAPSRSAGVAPRQPSGRDDSQDRRPGQGPENRAGHSVILPPADAIDLTRASGARLTFESWLAAASARGEIQLSIDGVNWITEAVVEPSSDWLAVGVDLHDWLGHLVEVRFVTTDLWRLRQIRLVIDRE